jgi:hypothetical protein
MHDVRAQKPAQTARGASPPATAEYSERISTDIRIRAHRLDRVH